MKLISLAWTIPCLFTLGCTVDTSQYDRIDWYMTNGTGNSMTVVLYDKLCHRTYYRINLPRSGEIAVTTCSDSDGRSDIRYRRSGRIADSNPWHDTVMRDGQTLVVRQ